MKAELLIRDKVTDEDGNLLEFVVWTVTVSEFYPDGVRYRFAYVRTGETKPIVLYDNHFPKGHHKHINNKEVPYSYSSVDKLFDDFLDDVKNIRETL